jgi:hypothetical protein
MGRLVASKSLRGVDVLVLFGLLRHRTGEWTVRSLARELHMPLATVQRALSRLSKTPVFDAPTRRVDISACQELIEHALPFLAPARLGARARGTPTAWAMPALVRRLRVSADAPQPVWPQGRGGMRGVSIRPLYPGVVSLAAADPEMHQLLALTDVMRLGDTRLRRRAAGLLLSWVAESPAAREH